MHVNQFVQWQTIFNFNVPASAKQLGQRTIRGYICNGWKWSVPNFGTFEVWADSYYAAIIEFKMTSAAGILQVSNYNVQSGN